MFQIITYDPQEVRLLQQHPRSSRMTPNPTDNTTQHSRTEILQDIMKKIMYEYYPHGPSELCLQFAQFLTEILSMSFSMALLRQIIAGISRHQETLCYYNGYLQQLTGLLGLPHDDQPFATQTHVSQRLPNTHGQPTSIKLVEDINHWNHFEHDFPDDAVSELLETSMETKDKFYQSNLARNGQQERWNLWVTKQSKNKLTVKSFSSQGTQGNTPHIPQTPEASTASSDLVEIEDFPFYSRQVVNIDCSQTDKKEKENKEVKEDKEKKETEQNKDKGKNKNKNKNKNIHNINMSNDHENNKENKKGVQIKDKNEQNENKKEESVLIKLTKPSDRTFIINNNFNRLLKEEAEYDRLRAEKEDKLKQEQIQLKRYNQNMRTTLLNAKLNLRRKKLPGF